MWKVLLRGSEEQDMNRSLETILAELSEEERARVLARAEEIKAEQMTMCDLRKARALTQKRVAERMKVTQESVSRMEKRSDLLLSTLTSYVTAMGGSLQLVATFPGRPQVVIAGFDDLNEDDPPEPPRRRTRRSTPRRQPAPEPVG
jgi:transcriptional regulator with XRE-family HTH domain